MEDIVAKKLEGRFAIINDVFVPTNGNQINPDILGALEYKLKTWSEKNKIDIGDSKMTFVPVIDSRDQWMIVSADTLDQKTESRFIFDKDTLLNEYKTHTAEERVAENKRRTEQKARQESIDGQGEYVAPRMRSGQGKLVPRVNDPDYDKDIADRIAKDLEENEKNRTDSRGRAVPSRAPGT